MVDGGTNEEKGQIGSEAAWQPYQRSPVLLANKLAGALPRKASVARSLLELPPRTL